MDRRQDSGFRQSAKVEKAPRRGNLRWRCLELLAAAVLAAAAVVATAAPARATTLW